MGYQSMFRVYDHKGKCLGKFAGWTPAEAIERAQRRYPEAKDLTAKYTGEENR